MKTHTPDEFDRAPVTQSGRTRLGRWGAGIIIAAVMLGAWFLFS